MSTLAASRAVASLNGIDVRCCVAKPSEHLIEPLLSAVGIANLDVAHSFSLPVLDNLYVGQTTGMLFAEVILTEVTPCGHAVRHRRTAAGRRPSL